MYVIVDITDEVEQDIHNPIATSLATPTRSETNPITVDELTAAETTPSTRRIIANSGELIES